MSRFLEEASRSKETENGGGNNLTVGFSSMQGWRDSMEDAHMLEYHLEGYPQLSCFGVFDGHGGTLVADTASKILLPEIMKTEEFQKSTSAESIMQAMCTGFLRADNVIREHPDCLNKTEEVGSTGVICMITPSDIIVGNVGDSRCFLSKLKENVAIPLSIDHKPNVENEKQRIISAGGTVFRGRVCGGVGVSRSFGDYWFKRNTDLADHEQLVSAEPCIYRHVRQETDEFIVLACDGIYDVMTNEEVQKFVRSCLDAKQIPGAICEALMEECLARGSRDNMSVILILFECALRKRITPETATKHGNGGGGGGGCVIM